MTARRTFRTPRAALAAFALAVVAVVALAGCATSTATGTQHRAAHQHRAEHQKQAALTSTHTPATARHIFDPYTASGKLTVAVVRRTEGSCWSTSLADPTSTAFRCFAGNQILDPCFARPNTARDQRGTVACIADPWSEATVLTLTKALPTAAFTTHRVWSFVRSDGATCVAATGTVPAVAGRNLDYNCSDHTFAALNDTRARHVRAVFAKLNATTLRTDTVRALWHS